MSAVADTAIRSDPFPAAVVPVNGTPPPDTEVTRARDWIDRLRREIARVLVGQGPLVDRLLVGLLANGHVLLEGVPGLAKTLTARSLALLVGAEFRRIQFTPDLLPADIVGTLVYEPETRSYHATRGPVFANLVLADEINRAPAKVQSALLEAMQERQVTLGGETLPLPSPFLVLATENPIDQEGTYPLPEAQVDRFMLKVQVGYPTFEEERRILDTLAFTQPETRLVPVVSVDEILAARAVVDRIQVHEGIRDYIVRLVFASRDPAGQGLDLGRWIQYGASPRATLALTLAARAWALLHRRTYVVPQDVKTLAPDVLRHRILLSYEAISRGVTADSLVRRILDSVPVP